MAPAGLTRRMGTQLVRSTVKSTLAGPISGASDNGARARSHGRQGSSTHARNAMKGYRTKRIALPGGRSIEIVYFYETGDDAAAAPAGEQEGETAPVATASPD